MSELGGTRSVADAVCNDMRGPFSFCAQNGRVVKAKDPMSVVDQHVELQKKILAENTAEVGVVRPDILHVEHKCFKIGDSVGAYFESIELHGE